MIICYNALVDVLNDHGFVHIAVSKLETKALWFFAKLNHLNHAKRHTVHEFRKT